MVSAFEARAVAARLVNNSLSFFDLTPKLVPMMGFKLATLYQQHKRPSLARRTASEVIRASYYDQEVTQAASTDVVAALDTLRTTTLQPLVIMKASPKKLQSTLVHEPSAQ